SPHVRRGVDDLGSRTLVVVVGDPGVGAGVTLDEHADAVMAHLEHSVRRDRNAMLVGLHLARYAHNRRSRHGFKVVPVRSAGTTSRMNRSMVSGVPKSENWHTNRSTPRSTSAESAAVTSSAAPAMTPPQEPTRRRTVGFV